jgi:hypothetical protein
MEQDKNPTRRRVLTIAGIGGASAVTVMLPAKWTRPIVESIVVPAHAQASSATTTSGTTSTTTTGE